MGSKGKLHMIGHAHLDPVWLWQWQEGFHEAKATFRSALDRMKEYDDFCFVSSSAVFYEWVEKSDPEMFAEIKERVAEGRWSLVGGWWIEPDCNIPCGESFVRQGLYGQRYFQSRFGKKARVGFNPDSFGHNAMLPQILKKSGLDYYVFMRPMPNEKGLPGRLFWWEADDGSRVLAFRIPYQYLTWGKDVDAQVRRCAAELKAPVDQLMCFYGVGNHGGGPTKENIESIHTLQQDHELPELVMSTPERFFQTVLEQGWDLPCVHDELQYHSRGCYSAQSGIKMGNRQAENLLLKAEKLALVANLRAGQPYPDDFDRAWKNVLFNQFHDILAGTSLEEAYRDAMHLHGEAMSIAERNLNYAVQAISWKIDIPEENGLRPIVVFNPLTWPVKIVTELESGGLSAGGALFTEDEEEVPVQLVQSQATAEGRYRISFLAEVPPLGYRVYKLYPERQGREWTSIEADDSYLDNGRYHLEFDRETGFISQLVDKSTGFSVFAGPAARPVVFSDNSDTWSHDIQRFDQNVGTFALESMRLVEDGPVKSVVRVVSSYNQSRLTQDFTMYKDLDQIDVNVTVDWRERFKGLKLKFPINVRFRKATYEIPYGSLERPVDGDEQPGGSWVDITGINTDSSIYGLALLNNGKYSFDVNGEEISLTVLRSPIYAHHVPAVPEDHRQYSFIDQGIQRFRYSLLPHRGSWEEGQVVKRAAELNQQVISLFETCHRGSLPLKDSFISVDKDNIVVSVLKQAEDNDDIIMRAYESAKRQTQATISLPKWDRTIQLDFGPAEIKTVRISRNKEIPPKETNLLEE